MAGKAKIVKLYKDRYQGSLDEKTCDTLEMLLKLDEENGCVPDLRHTIYKIDESVVDDCITAGEKNAFMIPEMKKSVGTLHDYQTVGVSLMYFAKNAILGDSVGLGKTVEIAALINLVKTEYAKNTNGHNQFRYLFLTEKNLAVQVRKELVGFTGEYVELLRSGEEKIINKFIENHDFHDSLTYSIVGTHSLFTTPAFISWIEQCRTLGNGFPFDLLVVDESSCLGNPKTQMVEGYKAISKYFSRIIFLNATPFETQLDIFYTQLSLLDNQLLPTKSNFIKEYCIYDYSGMFPRPTGKYKNTDNFRNLIGYRYFARTRRKQNATFVDCDGKIILSPLSQIQKEWLQKTQLNRMVYDCPTALDPNIDFNEENIPKLKSLTDLFTHDCADFETILIFVHYKEAQALLSKWLTTKGYTNRVLNGETAFDDRIKIIDGFKRNDFRILITNVQKGLNFGNCNCCIFYSYDPNPSKMIQFEGRITRSFDISGKHVFLLCSLGKEKKRLDEVVTERAKATKEMSSTDFSVILDLLLQGDD